jgi:uncharacterized membrane protein
MRVVLIASYLANAALLVLSLAILPDRAAIHFSLGGMADRWAPKHVSALIPLGVYTVLFLCLYFSPRLLLLSPSKRVDLPDKHRRLSAEYRGLAMARVSAAVYRFGVAVFLFLLATGLLTVQANLSSPVRLNTVVFLPLLVLFLGYSTVWCTRLGRSFRLPESQERPDRLPQTGR